MERVNPKIIIVPVEATKFSTSPMLPYFKFPEPHQTYIDISRELYRPAGRIKGGGFFQE